jgi:hypothetical protein
MVQHSGIDSGAIAFLLTEMVILDRVEIIKYETVVNPELNHLIGANCTYQLSEWRREQMKSGRVQ